MVFMFVIRSQSKVIAGAFVGTHPLTPTQRKETELQRWKSIGPRGGLPSQEQHNHAAGPITFAETNELGKSMAALQNLHHKTSQRGSPCVTQHERSETQGTQRKMARASDALG
jgi:hypothetical protein